MYVKRFRHWAILDHSAPPGNGGVAARAAFFLDMGRKNRLVSSFLSKMSVNLRIDRSRFHAAVDFQTLEDPQKARTRLPHPHGHQERQESPRQKTPEGPQAPGGGHLREIGRAIYGNSFPPAARIRSPVEYDRVFKAGKPFHSANFKVIVAEGGAGWSRLGLVVSRRVGDAVRRNRVKRRIREWFRLCRSNFAAPVDIVVVAKSGSAILEYGQIARELDLAVGRWRQG